MLMHCLYRFLGPEVQAGVFRGADRGCSARVYQCFKSSGGINDSVLLPQYGGFINVFICLWNWLMELNYFCGHLTYIGS